MSRMARNKVDHWTVAYREEIINTFKKDVFPFIGKRPISEIKQLELLEVLRQIEKRVALEKTREVRQRCRAARSIAMQS